MSGVIERFKASLSNVRPRSVLAATVVLTAAWTWYDYQKGDKLVKPIQMDETEQAKWNAKILQKQKRKANLNENVEKEMQ